MSDIKDWEEIEEITLLFPYRGEQIIRQEDKLFCYLQQQRIYHSLSTIEKWSLAVVRKNWWNDNSPNHKVLTMGPEEMLKFWYYKLLGNESSGKEKNDSSTNSGGDEDDIEYVDTVKITQKSMLDGNTTFTELDEEENNSTSYQDPIIMIRQFKKGGDSLSLPKTLRELKPSAVVLYDVDISAVRQIEVYQASEADKQFKVFFLVYGGSVEEQAYLTTLRREKDAFESLIKEKSTIVMEDPRVVGMTKDDTESILAAASSRKGGLVNAPAQQQRILVDMREFRSQLPSLIHKRGIHLEPITLAVGDYILSPEMCVERKSISDLIGSLNSGRLYTQALAMTRFYAKPILLIEFDENKPFALQGKYFLSSDTSSNDIRSKLQLLTMHFPKLRLVWSPSPFASAQLFHELKEGKEEPVASVAAAIGTEEGSGGLDEDKAADKYNINIQDFVSKLPGVNTKNIRVVLNKGKSLDHLLTLSQEELSEMLGNSANGEALFSALHKAPKAEGAMFRGKGTKPNKGPFRKKRRELT